MDMNMIFVSAAGDILSNGVFLYFIFVFFLSFVVPFSRPILVCRTYERTYDSSNMFTILSSVCEPQIHMDKLQISWVDAIL